jgi:glycosyltransferase involved in cell wall biosynthesis
VDELLRCADLFLLPSESESFGLAALEAMACGTPVVATRAGAFPEIVEDGISGLLVPPGDEAALARAIATMLENSLRCRAMGEAGARRIRERFSWRRSAEVMLALYQDVLAERRNGRARSHAMAAEAVR